MEITLIYSINYPNGHYEIVEVSEGSALAELKSDCYAHGYRLHYEGIKSFNY